VARGIAATDILLLLTRDPEQTLLKIMHPGSIVVIASKKRWWRTAEERLQRICERKGHQVALIYSR
jgi:predicted site-specific integrase-resolvase